MLKPLICLCVAGSVLLLDSLFMNRLFANTDASVQRGFFLFLLIGGLWLTESFHLTVTALLVPVLAVLLGLLEVKPALAPFADPIIALFFGGFVLAAALRVHGLDRLLAARLVRLARGKLLPASLLLFAVTALISMWVSNTATAAMMLPIALGLVAHVDRERSRSTVVFVLLGIAWMASLGGMGSLVGSPPNALAAAEAGWGFRDWFVVGLPALLLLGPLSILLLYVVLRPNLQGEAVEVAISDVRWSRGSTLTIVIFVITVCLWIFSMPVSAWLEIDKDFDAMVAVGAAVLLVASGALSWKQAEQRVEWGVLLLFGGGLCLGMVLKSSGTSAWMAQAAVSWVEGWPVWLILLVLATFIVLLSELASNTAATALLLPLLMPMAPVLNMEPGMMAAFVALTASCGFMLPVATPPNAIIYGSGEVTQREMIRAGLWLDILCIVVLVLMFL